MAAALATGAAFLGGRPTGRLATALVAAAALRPVALGAAAALAAPARAAGAALVARAGAAARALETRPVTLAAGALAAVALAAASFLAGAFLELRSALKPAAGLKRMPLEAAIFTGWPVRGLRPVRALRDVGLKLPKP